MKEEVKRILKMVEDGKISSDKGEELLEAINNTEKSEIIYVGEQDKKSNGGKMIKIRILSHEGDRVNVMLPLKFVSGMIKAFGKIPNINIENMEGIDGKEMADTVMAAIDGGIEGEIVDIESSEGDIVKIVIE